MKTYDEKIGFIGCAFNLQNKGTTYEVIYCRV